MNIAPPVFLPTIIPPAASAPVVDVQFAALIAALPIAAPMPVAAVADHSDDAAPDCHDDAPPSTIGPEPLPIMPAPWLLIPHPTRPVEKETKEPAAEAAATVLRAPMELALPIVPPRNAEMFSIVAAAPTPDQTLNLLRDTAWVDTLAREIVAASITTDRVSFRLMPERLGPLEVNLTQSDAGFIVSMKTHSDEAAAIISSAQPRLMDDMKANGLRVTETQVSSDTSSHHRQSDQPKRPPPLIETARHESEIQTPKTQPDGRYA